LVGRFKKYKFSYLFHNFINFKVPLLQITKFELIYSLAKLTDSFQA